MAYHAFKSTGGKVVARSWEDLKQSYSYTVTLLANDSEARMLIDKDGDGVITFYELMLTLYEYITAKTAEQKG